MSHTYISGQKFWRNIEENPKSKVHPVLSQTFLKKSVSIWNDFNFDINFVRWEQKQHEGAVTCSRWLADNPIPSSGTHSSFNTRISLFSSLITKCTCTSWMWNCSFHRHLSSALSFHTMVTTLIVWCWQLEVSWFKLYMNNCFIVLLSFCQKTQNIHIKFKKKDEATEPKEANKACV